MKSITDAMDLLAANGSLPVQYRPHKLSGNLQDIWECHIEPDWLMTWKQNDTELTLLVPSNRYAFRLVLTPSTPRIIIRRDISKMFRRCC